jgi:uncharacterized Zn-finger protein
MEKIISCKCGRRYRVPVTYFGKSFICDKCGQVVDVAPVEIQKRISIACPSCTRTLRITEKTISKEVKCQYCGTEFIAQPPPKPQPQPAVPEQGTKRCPFCDEIIQEEAKVCRHCKSHLVKTCPYCAEEISAIAKKCKHCGSMLKPLTYPEKPPERTIVGQKRSIFMWSFLLIGFPILIFLCLLFSIMTSAIREAAGMVIIWILCILLWVVLIFVFLYRVGSDIKRHYIKSTLNPGLYVGLLIIFVLILSVFPRTPDYFIPRIFCTVAQLVFIMYIMYKYARETYEMFIDDEKPVSDLSIVCMLLGFFCFPISLLIIQHQLNRHWETHEHLIRY